MSRSYEIIKTDFVLEMSVGVPSTVDRDTFKVCLSVFTMILTTSIAVNIYLCIRNKKMTNICKQQQQKFKMLLLTEKTATNSPVIKCNFKPNEEAAARDPNYENLTPPYVALSDAVYEQIQIDKNDR